MSADEAISHITFFIAAVVVAVALCGVIIGVGTEMSGDITAHGSSMSGSLLTDIKIINDPTIMPYENDTLTIYIMNTGENALSFNELTILIDGQYCNYTMTNGQSLNGTWSASSVAQVRVNVALTSGDHNVRVVLPDGVYDSLTFRI